MIVFGFGRRTMKDRGPSAAYACPRCHNDVRFKLVEQRTWFTLFFIPVVPYNHKYLELCPICGFGREMTRPEFDAAMVAAKEDHAYLTQ